MNPDRLVRWLERQRRVSVDRWVLRAIAFSSAVGVAVIDHLVSVRGSPWIIVVVVALAAMASFDPDSHFPTAVVLLVVWQWLVVVGDPLSVWLPVVAVGLYLHHASTALMAVLPESAAIPGTVVRRWLVASAGVAAATIATWALVVALDRRDLQGSASLTAATFVVVATLAGVAIVRTRRPS